MGAQYFPHFDANQDDHQDEREEAGRREKSEAVGRAEVIGRPITYGTTRGFLEYFGIKSLDDLPSLAALKDMDDVGIQLEFDGPVTVQAVPAGLPAANDADVTA